MYDFVLYVQCDAVIVGNHRKLRVFQLVVTRLCRTCADGVEKLVVSRLTAVCDNPKRNVIFAIGNVFDIARNVAVFKVDEKECFACVISSVLIEITSALITLSI